MNSRTSVSPDLVVLLFIVLICGAVLLVISNPLARILTGIVLAFLLPGYLLLRVLWPLGKELDSLWRLSMILPTSIAVVGALLLLVNYLGVYEYNKVVTLLILIDIALVIGVALRSKKVSSAKRGEWNSQYYDFMNRVRAYRPSGWHVVLALSFVVLIGSIIYAAWIPKKPLNFTEFYVLTPDGHLPLSFVRPLDSELSLDLVINNHEGRTVDYRVAIMAKTPDTVILLWSGSAATLDGATIEQPVRLELPSQDIEALLLLLFLDDHTEPYRSLRLVFETPSAQ